MGTYEVLAKLNRAVIPAKAGVQNFLKRLDSCFRRNDGEGLLQEPLMTTINNIIENEGRK